MLIVRQQQCLIPRQPVGSCADQTLAIEEQPLRLRPALGGQTEAEQADRATALVSMAAGQTGRDHFAPVHPEERLPSSRQPPPAPPELTVL